MFVSVCRKRVHSAEPCSDLCVVTAVSAVCAPSQSLYHQPPLTNSVPFISLWTSRAKAVLGKAAATFPHLRSAPERPLWWMARVLQEGQRMQSRLGWMSSSSWRCSRRSESSASRSRACRRKSKTSDTKVFNSFRYRDTQLHAIINAQRFTCERASWPLMCASTGRSWHTRCWS